MRKEGQSLHHCTFSMQVLKIHCLCFTRKTKGASSASIKIMKRQKTPLDSCTRNRRKTSVTENRSMTQKLGIDKIQNAWLHAYMKQCQGGLLVSKGMEKLKSKSLKHLSIQSHNRTNVFCLCMSDLAQKTASHLWILLTTFSLCARNTW